MTNNVTLPGTGAIVETLDQGGGVERQVVSAVQNGTWTVSGSFFQATQPVSIATAPALVAGTAIIGKVGIDQTTPGTTNKVAVTALSEVWKAGTLATLTWATSGFSTEVNSVVNGNAVIAAAAVDNSSTLDEFFDLSISLGSVTPGAGAPYIGFYLVPFNQDGTTYGDGRFGSSAAGPPASQYFIGSVPCIASTAGVITGMIRGILLPPGSFKLILYNQAGVTLAGSANTIKIRSYNRSVS